MPSVGDQLKTTREQQGKSLEDISGELKIRIDHVLALEEGDFDKFDAPVFVRGFVRSYCRILKIDSAPVVVQLNQELGGTEALASDPALPPGKKGFVDTRLQFNAGQHKVAIAAGAAVFQARVGQRLEP